MLTLTMEATSHGVTGIAKVFTRSHRQ